MTEIYIIYSALFMAAVILFRLILQYRLDNIETFLLLTLPVSWPIFVAILPAIVVALLFILIVIRSAE